MSRYKRIRESVQNIADFSQVYQQRFNKTAVREDGKGFLQQKCVIEVHDYGTFESKPRYQINGIDYPLYEDNDLFKPLAPFENLADLKKRASFLETKNRPKWSSSRWISVDGINGEIIQFILQEISLGSQAIFNSIVDPKPQTLGKLLEGLSQQTTDFLLVTKVPSLTKEAEDSEKVNVDGDHLFLYDTKKIHSCETTSYVISMGPASGVLLTVQEGKLGDVFDDVRLRLFDPVSSVRMEGVDSLFLELVRESVESAMLIEHYIDECLEQLEKSFLQDSQSNLLCNAARNVELECDFMCCIIKPVSPNLLSMLTVAGAGESGGLFREGHLKTKLLNMANLLKRLGENILSGKLRAHNCREQFHTNKVKRIEDSKKKN